MRFYGYKEKDINKGDYIGQYPNFRHGKTNGHDKTVGLTFIRNELERIY